MKRFTAFLLMLLLVLTLCSCGKRRVQEEPVPPDVQEHIGGEQQPVDPAPDTTEPVVVPEEPITPANPPAKPDKQEEPPEEPYYHGGSTTKNLTITEGKTVNGGTYQNVTIAESVGNGTVTLQNVTIKGELIVQGGGSNSIKMVGCDVSTVVLDKDTSGANAQEPRLELTGTEVQSVKVAKPAIIEATDSNSAVKTLSAKDDVTIKGENTEITSVIVPTDAGNDVKLTVNDASVAKVEVNKPVTIETNAAVGKTPVAAVEAKADVTVSGAATNVGTITVPKEAASPVTLTVTDAKVKEVTAAKPVTITANENASKIEKVDAAAAVTVEGDTKINKVEAKAPVTVDGAKTKIETITVPAGVTTAPEITVTKGSVNTVEAKSEASVSGGSNAIANVEAAAPVEVASAAVAKVTVVNVTVNVTVTVNGNGQIEVAVDTDANVEIQAENTEKLSVSTTQTVTNNITVKQGEATQTVHIHKWVESGRKEADCTTNGYIDYKCTTCSETKRETIPAKGHVEVVIPAVERTCTAAGSTAGKKCAVCDAVIVANREIKALGHDFTGSYLSDETGHWHVCAYCGMTDARSTHKYSTTDCTVAAKCTECGYQKAAGTHTWDAGTVKTAAICEQAGSIEYTCTSCSATKTETVAALGHTYGVPGYQWSGTSCTATRSCTRSGCSHADSAIAQVSSYELKAPSCTEKGVTVYTATVVFDGKTYTDTKTADISATGHTSVKQNGQAATCTADGWKDYYECSVCHKYFSDLACENEITNLGVWKTGGGKVAALGHAYGTPSYEWKGDSCTASRACANDNSHIETETVDGAYTVVTKPTYTTAGSAVYKATFTNTAFVEQTSEAVTLPATPFVVDGEKYDTFEKALAAAHGKGLRNEQLDNLNYQVYPTVEIYGSCTMTNLNVATHDSITVKNGGSLTVNGALTLATSTMDYWMLDAGVITVENGGSFKWGDVQYTGTDAVFTMNDDKNIALTGCPKDVKESGIFFLLNGDVTLNEYFTTEGISNMIVQQKLTVKDTLTNTTQLENRGTIDVLSGGSKIVNEGRIENIGLIDINTNGKLNNTGTIDNKKTIEVYGGTLTNEAGGEIKGIYETTDIKDLYDWSTYVSIEKGATLTNDGTITDLINVADYYTSSGKTAYVYNNSGTLGEKARVEKVAAVFDRSQLQTVWDDGSYVNVIVSGTEENSTVDLSGVTIPRGQRLVLKESVFDGEKTYHNSYTVSSGELEVEGKEKNVNDGPTGELVTVGAPDVTVATGGKILTYGFAAFDKLTVNGHVDCEADMLLVAQSLTIGAEGKLEIGGEGTLHCNDGVKVTIAEGGQLMSTTRYMNGITDGHLWKKSTIEGVEPTATMTTLVITDDTLLYGDHTVDAIVSVNGKLQLFTGSTLRYKQILDAEGNEIAQNVLPDWAKAATDPDTDGYYTLSGNFDGTVVKNAAELTTALEKGGDIYLLPFVQGERTYVPMEYPDGSIEDTYETQYHINTTDIDKDTNLISLGGEEPIAVFFDKGFTVAEGKTLKFNGLNVVAAADSTVKGRVEAYNGILVVQGENGATLTNNGIIQIGSVEVWGRFAIFDESKPNKIVNNGTIESYGDLIFDLDREKGQFEGNEPLEYANYADVVRDLYDQFREYPNMIELADDDEKLVTAFRDGHELFNEENPGDADFGAIMGFAWLIKNEIVPQHSNQNPGLNPYHYVTFDEVGELFNKFATKVLGTATDLGITGNGLICRTENIEVTEQDGNKWHTSELNRCFDALREALNSLSSVNAATEEDFLNALDTPYVTEIHIKGNIELSSNTDLQPAGEHHDQHRKIFVEPNFTLTVPQGIQMDIKQNVKLVIVCDDKGTEDNEDDIRGRLIVNGNVNVFGELEPDEWDESRITVDREHGGNISFFGNAYFFGERLLEVAGDYMDMENLNIPKDYDWIDGWDNDGRVKCLVAYGLQPEEDNGHKWWNFGRPLVYDEMKTILTNIYRDATDNGEAALPDTVKAGDERWTPNDDECLDNRNVEELLSKFSAALPKMNDDRTEIVLKHTENEDNTDGMTITGKTFINMVTITCDTAPTDDDNFGGDIWFKNCEFSGGVAVQLAAGVNYNIRLDGCTGNFNVTATDAVKSANNTGVNFFGDLSGVTVNGLTISGINGWNDEDYNINVRYDECGKGQYISTVEVTNNRDDAVYVSGNYSGKLRIGGNMNIRDLTMGEGSMLELCNEPGEANIALGSNRITVNDDCGGDYHFTGNGEVYVPNQNGRAHISVNGVYLDAPHVFGKSEPYGIFIPVGSNTDIEVTVKEGEIEPFSFVVQYKEDDGGRNLIQDGVNAWIGNPNDVCLTIKVEDGCTVVYENLHYKSETATN